MAHAPRDHAHHPQSTGNGLTLPVVETRGVSRNAIRRCRIDIKTLKGDRSRSPFLVKLFFILDDYTTVLWYTVGTLNEREKGTRT